MARKYINNYDQRYSSREMSRNAGLDPGDGPSLEDFVPNCTGPDETPTLASMTTSAGEPPSIGSVGEAPRGQSEIPRSQLHAGKNLNTGAPE